MFKKFEEIYLTVLRDVVGAKAVVAVALMAVSQTR